ncbi:MAG: NAD-dependent epimerase/dehydratase family protein [Acidobacteriota bacterium]
MRNGKTLVTGGAGFLGSHLVDRLLADGHDVVVLDNFSTGQRRFLEPAVTSGRCRIVEGDLLDPTSLRQALDGCGLVAHLAANADVRRGLDHPRRDLEQNAFATSALLEAMREAGVERLLFASTGAIYGEPTIFPTPEDAPLPIQTSLYGASKLAAEGLISAYCHGFGLRARIFRFVSILGPRYSHGHVFDFVRKLLISPDAIDVLGDGRQRKSYLHVTDCIEGMLRALEATPEDVPVAVYNLGHTESCTVDTSLDWICQRLGVAPERRYAGGARGWIGDSPRVELDCSRLHQLGWRPTRGIRESVESTVDSLLAHRWLLDARG